MKRTTISLLGPAALAVTLSNIFAADEIPKQEAFARYEAMMNRSPFAVASAAAPAPAATPNFAKDLYIANVAKNTPEGDLVTVASSTDKNFKKYLNTRETIDGYSISNIEWAERVGETKVTVNKDGQFATLAFNQALLAQPLPNSPPVPQPQVQVTPPMQGVPGAGGRNVVRPAPIPTLPTPPPRVRGVIQRNPTQQVQPQVQPEVVPEEDQ